MHPVLKRWWFTFYFLFISLGSSAQDADRYIRFIFCSDSHYGTFRSFRGADSVSAREVNRIMLESMLNLSTDTLPCDGLPNEGSLVGPVDFIIHAGDVVNRMSGRVQPASVSWNEFYQDWVPATDSCGIRLYVLPGNHDLSNAIGYPTGLNQPTDTIVLTGMYRMHIDENRQTIDPVRDKINYYFIQDSVVFIFAGLWPESATRSWMQHTLAAYRHLPWIVFAHDSPLINARHLTHPQQVLDTTRGYRFENLVSDASSVERTDQKAFSEHHQLAAFVAAHPQIVAYFHGDTHINEFYDWPVADDRLVPVFRVDSPMSGLISGRLQQLVSYHYAVLDLQENTLTVREYFWNRPLSKWGPGRVVRYAPRYGCSEEGFPF